MPANKKSTMKILDYLQANIPSEKELTAGQPGQRKPKSVQETAATNSLDQDFNDAISPEIDEAVEPVNSAEVGLPADNYAQQPTPTPTKPRDRKKRLIDSMKTAFG